jgi:hypothetical protein
MKIFEHWKRVVSKNKTPFALINHNLHYYVPTLWHATQKQSVINAAK